jgi:FkbM family methyltransferase
MPIRPKAILRLARTPYVFQPLQVLKRLRQEFLWNSRKEVIVTLPWGLPIKVNPHEAIGSNIAYQGLYELAVTETLWRLTDQGEMAIDVGANIGYAASILRARVGPSGQVLCFEPHPEVFAALAENVELWEKRDKCSPVALHRMALGEQDGKAFLHTNDWFRTNRGTAWISNNGSVANPDERVHEVSIRTLDSMVEANQSIGLLKIDVEGSALGVLLGMKLLLKGRRVRDIVFEEETSFPAPTHVFLREHGYSIFGLQERFAGIRRRPDAKPRFDRVLGPTPNYLATLDATRAVSRLTPSLWRSFGLTRFLNR